LWKWDDISGSKNLGHYYIGIDISPEYIQFAEHRLQHFEKELIFARQELAKHTVAKTFKERKAKGEFTGKYGPKRTETDLQLFHTANHKVCSPPRRKKSL